MDQVEVVDFSLSEPDLASIVKQIYNGALRRRRMIHACCAAGQVSRRLRWAWCPRSSWPTRCGSGSGWCSTPSPWPSWCFFWRAVYGNTATIAGLTCSTTLTYILLAQIFAPLTDIDLIFEFGYDLREGGIVHALLRPVDFQGMYYAQNLVRPGTALVLQIPMALVATFVFGLRMARRSAGVGGLPALGPAGFHRTVLLRCTAWPA